MITPPFKWAIIGIPNRYRNRVSNAFVSDPDFDFDPDEPTTNNQQPSSLVTVLRVNPSNSEKQGQDRSLTLQPETNFTLYPYPGNFTEMKTVGWRNTAPSSSEDAVGRAWKLIQASAQLAGRPRPRGFVFKAKDYQVYEAWKRAQPNPRLW